MRVLPLALEISPYEFACDGPFVGIPHFWNVITNVPFVVLGLWQLRRVKRLRQAGVSVSFNWTGLWLSTIGIGLGSGIYHWFLTPFGLGIDRLAIAGLIAFLLLHTADVALGIGPNRRLSLWVFLACEASVLLWMLGGTAWIYAGLQACGALVVLLAFGLADLKARQTGRTKRPPSGPVYAFAACYALAKIFEILDAPICELTGFLGGHPLKHLAAAVGLLFLSRMMPTDEGV